MQTVKSILTKESFDNMIANNRHNPASIIHFRDKTGKHSYVINAGESDYVDTFRENSITYVLSYNYDIDYIGLEAFKGDVKMGDIFFQESQIKEVLNEGLNLTPITMVKRLKEYL